MRTDSSPSQISSSSIPDSSSSSISFLTLRMSIRHSEMRSGALNLFYGRFQGQAVTAGAQSADHPYRHIGKVGVLTERLALVHVRQVNFDEWDAHRQQRVTQCDTGMGEGGRVDHDEVDALAAGGVDAFDQQVFGVALQVQQPVAAGL